MKPSVYIETTVISYLTAWPGRDLIRLSHEVLTRDWWQDVRPQFDVCTSELVFQEAARGDPAAAADRVRALANIPILPITSEVYKVAKELAAAMSLPTRAEPDAVHLAATACHGISFLLTWNCRHLANAILADKIQQVCQSNGLKSPRVVTPEQLMSAT